MRKILSLLALVLLATPAAFSQDATPKENTPAPKEAETAKVVFMRSTGYNGSLAAFTTFIDDQLVCRLNNKRFSTHTVAPGEHTFSVQFAGKGSKEKAERIRITTEPGKTYYIQLIFQPGFVKNNLYCQEVTQSSANLLLPQMKEDTECL